MNISPTNPLGWLWLDLRTRFDRVRNTSDRGASAIEWVIITAVVVAIAAAIATAVWTFVDGQKGNIEETEIPEGP